MIEKEFTSSDSSEQTLLSGTSNTVMLVYELKWTMDLLVCFRRVRSVSEVQLFLFMAVLTSSIGSIIQDNVNLKETTETEQMTLVC